MSLIDAFNRTVTNVRISVTDRCNFRCRYCMPEEGMQWLDRHEILSYEEIARLVRILAQHGVRKVRLTGGEPLMRKDLDHLVRLLVAIPGIDDCALTTNGVFLSEQAAPLKSAGLHRVNVSLDSLDAETFTTMTRRDHFDDVWRGIEAADAAGLQPIKLNVVLIRGVNDHEVPKFAELARERGFIPRFIEFMPIGMDDGWSRDKVVAGAEVVAAMERSTGIRLLPFEKAGAQPADRFVFEDGIGEIGFINSVSEPFCGNCDRVRITSDGKLRTCLFSLREIDLKALMRTGAADTTIAEAISSAVARKEPGHLINDPAFVRPERTMSQIGG